ncbi:hypothetical protein ABE61_16330 [Lysinibacillus sphaericus]|uniref:DUF4272 domain-containing protein n=1 Tax=Lysinibacillus sphaericus TaxID=1421 RepID=UPI0018CEC9A1|nr:DUF4272 domain-containing protein [Lysinibacillus sphaericus]MBG9455588.1 hypothetical protein [Lysinibacillus sphaericus]MBG9478005.1 hypothetical protein [Lysinibacillus sphaericus]MBG9594145.1 hypothetical protein [Lysinibacillus sphaericus]
MNYFTIFASKNNIDDIEFKISDVFAKGFAIGKNENEYLLKSKALFKKHKLIVRVMSEDTNPDYFVNNIPGMMGYYNNIPFEDDHLKDLVLTQISVLNTVIAIESEKEINEDQLLLFTDLLSKIGGIGFLPNGTLLDDEGAVIVYPDGQSGPSNFRPQACPRKVMGQEVSSEEGEQRKNNTIAYLKERAISYTASLPQLPPIEDCQFKTQEDIARRAVALLIVIQFACDVAQGGNVEESRDFFINMLRTYKVENDLTENERDFLQASEPDVQEAINISWQYEAYWTLIWALGFVEELDFPDEVCDCEYAIQVVSNCETFEQFYLQAIMRSQEEILDEADKIYRYHWACVDSRIQERTAPAGMNESIVMERRRGLFWMVGHRNEEWDTISMDT